MPLTRSAPLALGRPLARATTATATATAFAALVASALVLASAPATSAAETYNEGEVVSLSVGQIPSTYVTYWVSDKDGYLAEGSSLRVDDLSVGLHRLWALIYRRRDNAQVWSGYLDVEIVARQPSSPPASGGNGTGTGGSTGGGTGGGTGTGTGTGSGGSTGTGAGGGSSSPALVAPGEFEPVTELLLGCPDIYQIEDVYPPMVEALAGVCRVRIFCDNDYVRYDLIDLFRAWGTPTSHVTYETLPLDSIWMRDYGPLYVKANGRLEVVDLDYYPGRPTDDAVPARIAQRDGLRVLPLRVYWEGGNFTADGLGNLFSTDQLEIANDHLSARTVESRVEQAFGGQLHILEQMLDDGGTGHLDMFCLFTSPSEVFINRFPRGHRNAARMDRQAAYLEGLGYQVTRMDLADRRYRSHTNGLLVNGVALVPTYGNRTTDAAALQLYADAGYAAVGIDCRRLIESAGAIHCITITVPQ